MKKALLFLQVLVMAVALVACGGGKKDSKVIKVGVISPETYGGEMIRKGIELAVEEVNQQGGIMKKKLEIVHINDENKPDVGKLQLRKAIESKKIDFILGGFSSGVVAPAMDVMAQYKKIWLGTGGASPKIIGKIKKNYEKYKYYFRVGTIDALQQGGAGAKFVINHLGPKFGVKKIALIGADHIYSKLMLGGIVIKKGDKTIVLGGSKKALEKAGYEIVYENYLPTSTTDFSPVFSQIKEKGAQIVLQAWPSTEAVTFVKQFNAQKVPAILIGATVESLKDEYFKETGGAAVYQADFSPQSGPAPMTTKTMKFANAFKKKYGKSAGYIAYPSYDTVYILKAAIEKAGSMDSAKLIPVLEGMEYEGNIWYNFIDKTHDLTMGVKNGKVYADFVWFQWKPDGTRKAVYPEAFKQADFELAPWVKAALKK